MATSRDNPPPALALELLQRGSRVIKARGRCRAHPRVRSSRAHPAARAQDYCGTLSEDSLRKNFILVYELLDEMIDYGCAPWLMNAQPRALGADSHATCSYAQSTSTEALKAAVFNDPVTPPQPRAWRAARSAVPC